VYFVQSYTVTKRVGVFVRFRAPLHRQCPVRLDSARELPFLPPLPAWPVILLIFE
jgi:hypothetical protein